MKLSDFDIRYGIKMSEHTTFRTGGPAQMFFEPKNEQELMGAFWAAKSQNIPVFVIGNGSNLLVRDGGIKGLVIKIGKNMSDILIDGEFLYAGSGAMVSAAAKAAANAGLGGFEFAYGIPGTVGGGLFMNAGAYGGELSDIVCEAVIFDGEDLRTVKKDEMGLSYRSSNFQKYGWIITKAVFKLHTENKDEIFEKMRDLKERRVSKQPLEFASAGSTFKRPQGFFAGTLIEEAGLKGYRIGDAQVSEKHAGFIINLGSASSKDILELIGYVQDKVYEKTGVRLEPEVRIIGSDC